MVVKETLARDIIRLLVWYPMRWIVELLPIKYGFVIFKMMGDVHYRLSRSKRTIITKNLQFAFGNRLSTIELLNSVRNYFRNHYVNQLQIFLFPRLTLNNIEEIHTFEGLHNLDKALKKGKGCILLHPHFGPTQLPLCDLGIRGYPMMQIGLPTDEGLSFIGRQVAFRLRMKYEKKIPARIISANSFLRPVFQWLGNNGVLMMTGDGAGGNKFIGKFEAIDFLGKFVLFPVGITSLAQKTLSPVLPMFTVIDADGRYRSIIHKPISIAGNENKNDAIYITGEFVKLMEEYIRRFPYLWHFWDEYQDRVMENNYTN